MIDTFFDIAGPVGGLVLLVSCCCIFVVGIPLSQWIDYRRDIKKHGKETADEIRKRW